MQSPHLFFESDDFPLLPGEELETNPGLFGKSLALWLGDRLRERGVEAQEILAEDFGWCIPIRSEPHSLYVVCVNDVECDEEDGADDAAAQEEGGEDDPGGSSKPAQTIWSNVTHWRVFAFAEGGLLKRLFGKDQRAEQLAELFAALRAILAEAPGVRDLREESA